MSTISASAFDVRVGYSPPKYSLSQLPALVQVWIDAQKHWVTNLDGSYVASSLSLVYLPYWVASGEGKASWRANIGIDRQEFQACSSCQGRGYTLVGNQRSACFVCNSSGRQTVTRTYWQQQMGVANAALKGRVIDNHSYVLHCGKRNFNTTEYTTDQQTRAQLEVLTPSSGTSEQAALSAAQGAIKRALEGEAYSIARGLGDRVDQLSLWDWALQVSDVRAYLYPVYIGVVAYGNEMINAHVDGITGAVWVKPPAAVKQARLNVVRRIWYIIMLVITGFLSYVSVEPREAGEFLLAGGIALATAFAFVELLVVPITRWGQNRKQ